MAQQQATRYRVKRLSHVTVLVADEERALKWYRNVLGCEVHTDQTLDFGGQPSRWLTVGFPGQDLEIAIMRPMPSPGKADPDPPGNGTMWVLEVDDCDAAVETMRRLGTTIEAEPSDAPWGRSAIIRDPDGNPFNLVEPADA